MIFYRLLFDFYYCINLRENINPPLALLALICWPMCFKKGRIVVFDEYKIRYVEGKVPGLPFRDRFLDAVWACASLLHLARQKVPHALRDCIGILRNDGISAISVNQGDGAAIRRPISIGLRTLVIVGRGET